MANADSCSSHTVHFIIPMPTWRCGEVLGVFHVNSPPERFVPIEILEKQTREKRCVLCLFGLQYFFGKSRLLEGWEFYSFKAIGCIKCASRNSRAHNPLVCYANKALDN